MMKHAKTPNQREEKHERRRNISQRSEIRRRRRKYENLLDNFNVTPPPYWHHYYCTEYYLFSVSFFSVFSKYIDIFVNAAPNSVSNIDRKKIKMKTGRFCYANKFRPKCCHRWIYKYCAIVLFILTLHTHTDGVCV